MLKYGQTDDFFATFRYIIKPVLLLALICFVFVLVAGISLQPLVDFALPKYSESVLIFHILSYELVLSVLRVPFELFISASMKREIIRIRIGKVILTIVLLFAFHDSLKMVATIIILANLINICVGYILLFYKLKKLKVAHQRLAVAQYFTMKKIIIHVGTHKTGSTFLQRFLETEKRVLLEKHKVAYIDKPTFYFSGIGKTTEVSEKTVNQIKQDRHYGAVKHAMCICT